MRLIVPSLAFQGPVGGSTAMYNLANAMHRRGHDVHMVHIPGSLPTVLPDATTVDELWWFDFDPGVHHHFGPQPDGSPLPGDIVLIYDPRLPAETGLPVQVVHGFAELSAGVADVPCPKVCVSRPLVAEAIRLGVPERQVAYIPCGLDQSKYGIRRPLDDRPLQVSTRYSAIPAKGSALALEAFQRVKESVPDLQVVAFGVERLADEVPEWFHYHRNPPQSVIVDDIYNESRVFVSASVSEGFGLTSLEAMACGCALVTSANGGSDEFAVDRDTALVSPPEDVDALTADLLLVLENDAERRRLAEAGREVALTFDWDRSAQSLEAFLEAYLAEPGRYQQERCVM